MTLNRPHRRNAIMMPEMNEELHDLFAPPRTTTR